MNLFFQRIRTATMLAMVVMSVPQLAHAQATDRLIVKYRSTSAAYLNPSFQAMAPLHAIANRAGLQMQFLRTTHNKAHVLGLDRFSDARSLKSLAAFMKTAMPDEIEYVKLDLLAQPALAA